MRAISLCLVVVTLALGSVAPTLGADVLCPLINEFKYIGTPFSIQVELYNPHDGYTNTACVFDIFGSKGDNMICVAITPMAPGEYRTLTPTLKNIRTIDYLVTVSKSKFRNYYPFLMILF